MITTTIYQEKNLLYLSFLDDVGMIQFSELERRLSSIFRCLEQDFTLLTDLSGVGEIDFACVNQIAELMERTVEAGVGQVLRVVPDPCKDIGFGILAAFHYPKSLPVRVFENLSEAMDALAIEHEMVFNDNCAPNADTPTRNGQNENAACFQV
jgi:ABC-type transporter Mla MlaB component